MFNNMMKFTSQDISGYPDQTTYKLNRMQEVIFSIWKAIYPVGSYYETSDNDFDPNDFWGGEWEDLGSGRWHRTA